MADDPDAARRRIRWIAILIIFMLSLAVLYMVAQRLHPTHHAGEVFVNTAGPAS